MTGGYPGRVRNVTLRSDRAQWVPLSDAVADLVRDGDSVALEGFTHLIPFAAGHEIIRQRRRDLTLVRMTPDLIYDQLIGAGCASRLVFSWGGNPGVGSLHRMRDALAAGWPAPLEIEEHSHAGMANRYVAGASGLPFAVLRGYAGTDLPAHAATISTVECPFTGERLAVAAAPRGAAPSYAHGYYDRDNAAYRAWDAISRDREAFTGWLRTVKEAA